MKIGLIKQRYVAEGGGSERYTNQLIAQLRERGHEISVFTARRSPGTGTTGVALQTVSLPRGPSFLRALSFALACRRLVLESDCDLVFSIERTIQQDIVRAGGGCHREWLRQRVRHSSRAARLALWLNPLHASLLWLERQTFSTGCSRAVIANSHRGKEEIIRHYGFPEERIHVVHNGVDCDRFRPSHSPPERSGLTLLFVGSGFERKGLGFAVRALSRLPESVRLLVAGKGNSAPYRRLAGRLGVGERLNFLGAITNIEEVYARGDILVHPAVYEPFSNACLEAMACGLPVITSRINGASEVVHTGVSGAIVEEPGDIDALAEAIRAFLDHGKRKAAAIEARHAAEQHSFSRNVEQTLDVIRNVRA